MKGVSYITNHKNQKTAVVIELKALTQYEDVVEDLLDGIIAESRKDEPTFSMEEIKASLKKKGKI